MISFDPPDEPGAFDTNCRQPGLTWLTAHPNHRGRPKDYWSPFRPVLADGFGNLCGYTCIFEPAGTVDHWISWKDAPQQAYEWSSYRYAAGWINSSKKTLDDQILDPFEVEDGWFEILLPSLQLVLTDQVPAAFQDRAEFTLRRLPIAHDERIVRLRRHWLMEYEEKHITLEGLRRYAPLVAKAVEKQQLTAPRCL